MNRFNSKESVVDDPVCNDIQVKVTSALVTPDDIAFVSSTSKRIINEIVIIDPYFIY
jgi:hypothetical protein